MTSLLWMSQPYGSRNGSHVVEVHGRIDDIAEWPAGRRGDWAGRVAEPEHDLRVRTVDECGEPRAKGVDLARLVEVAGLYASAAAVSRSC